MLTDVIAALATPPGRSAVALIRVSGKGAHDVAGATLRPFEAAGDRRLRQSQVVHPGSGERLDDVLYATFTGPASFTGEDMVEISTHGGLLAPAETMDALLAAGARLATRGEFTRRALLNGKIDLLQAEAVGDLIEATAPAQRRAALMQLERGLSARIDALRSLVLELDALVCYEIDFPEEDSGPVPPERVAGAIADLTGAFDAMLATAADGERLRAGAMVVIGGKPNAGKSSLFNALVGNDRAIVTELPGTTRDAIEAPITCDGFPVRLIDTAGLRETEDRVERLGVEVSQRYLDDADLVLFCAEAGRPLDADEEAFLDGVASRALLVRTKSDLVGSGTAAPGLPVSIRSGDGLASLRAELARLAFAGLSGGVVEPLVTRARHRVALEKARGEIERFGDARARGVDGAVAAVHLRAAVTALEDIIGLVAPDDVLDRVFSSFCIGK